MSQSKKCILSNGLCVLSIKKKTNDLILLALTDFNKIGKFIFDTTEKKVIGSNVDLKLKSDDLVLIQDWVKSFEKVSMAKESNSVVVKD